MTEEQHNLGALSSEEQNLLQKIMSIGVGNAAADLGAVIDIHVQLSVPTITVIPSVELLNHIRKNVSDAHEISIIEQNFWSKIQGTAMLIFTTGAGRALLSLMGAIGKEQVFESDPMHTLEKEMLMEIGNILTGACVGKVAELLGDFVIYSPPRVLIGAIESANLSKMVFDQKNFATILQTTFNFEEQDFKGCLFLIINHESIGWLRQALKNFSGQ
ncbi:MAG: chemotaxis protein CheC [Syntrophorhabdaceae bacterium]|nr:chemotaxis protein CheC [Syntrophorhabdaceae bacterium]